MYYALNHDEHSNELAATNVAMQIRSSLNNYDATTNFCDHQTFHGHVWRLKYSMIRKWVWASQVLTQEVLDDLEL